jgi:DNA repair exonuclease SbcCD ATPase subunit
MDSASKAEDRTARIGRVLHRGAVFLVAIGIGIAGTLAWQGPGSDPTKQKTANWARQQGGESPAKVLSSTTDNAAGQPSPAAQGPVREVPPSRQAAVTPVGPGAPTHQVQQLEAMTRDLAAVRQNVEQLARDQKQLAPDQRQMAADQKQLAARQEQMAADQKQLTTRQEQMAADQKQLAASQEQMKVDLRHDLAAGQEQVAHQITELQAAVQKIQDEISAPPARARKPGRQARP